MTWGQWCICSVARVNETHGPTHMQEKIVLGCRSHRRKLMFQLSLEWKFSSFPVCCCFSCLCAFLLVLCVRVHLNWFLCAHGVCTRWHSIAFAPYTGVCNQAHGVSTAAPVEVRAPDVLGVSLTGISNPKQGAVLSSSCAVGFVLSVWLRGLDPFWIGGLGEVSPSSQEVSAGPGLSDGSSFVLQTHLLGSWGCLRRGTSNPGWCCCSSRLHWTGF